MDEQLREIVDDLEAEQRDLGELLERLSPSQWELQTHAPGWLVRDQVMHLSQFDEAATLALRDPEGFKAAARERREQANAEERYLAAGRALTAADLLERWKRTARELGAEARTAQPGGRVPWYGPAMSLGSFLTARMMETWSHGLDVADAVGATAPETDRLRHVAFIACRARPYSYQNRGMELPPGDVYVELALPSGRHWTFGDSASPDRVEGEASEFCAVLTRRRHVDDTALRVTGGAAREWMEIGQAFAWPPGDGRQPGQFAPRD
jgi:uncharacterized protein (TIGR03084 family)